MITAFILACTDEPNQTNFMVSVKNISSSTMRIEAFEKKSIVFQEDLSTGENSSSCNYTDENFRGIFQNYCGIDSMVVKFNNQQGYISINNNLGDFNFSNKRNPLLPNGGFEIKGNIYEFLVTEEDFENAFELPE
ncbi:MAG: hypothetical protein AB3N10_20055 [Allomuricauda sp.]